jgi:hypothetical protein
MTALVNRSATVLVVVDTQNAVVAPVAQSVGN